MVYLFLADGFEITEAMAPLDVLTRAGKTVTTVGIGSKTPKSSSGVQVVADCTDDGFVLPQDAELVILPGGMPGTTHLLESQTVHDVLVEAARRDILIGAICAAPWVLDEAGLLNGRIATMYPTLREHMKNGSYTGEAVVVDGKIITGRSAGCAMAFGLMLVSRLCGRETSEKIKHSIYPNW